MSWRYLEYRRKLVTHDKDKKAQTRERLSFYNRECTQETGTPFISAVSMRRWLRG